MSSRPHPFVYPSGLEAIPPTGSLTAASFLPPFASFPPHDLLRALADLLYLLLLDCLLGACRAVDSLRLSLTSDRRVFLGAIHPIFLARARVKRFAEKAFTLHHGSQTSAIQPLIGEGFTPFFLHLYLHTLPLPAIALRPSPLYV